MKTIILALAAILHLASSGHGKVEDPPSIAVTIEGHEEPASRILVAVWPDGMMVWSKDQTKGGPPFLSGQVDAAKILEFLTGLEKDQVFRKDPDFLVQIGPDASHHSIHLRSGKKHVELLSWHELFEENPKLIATSHGITSLDGRKREDVLLADVKDYQEFRKLWSGIRAFAKNLIPKEGKPYDQPLKLNFGE